MTGLARGQVNKCPRAGDDDGREEENAEAAASMGPAGHGGHMRAVGGVRPADSGEHTEVSVVVEQYGSGGPCWPLNSIYYEKVPT